MAVIDSGCPTTVCGEKWFENYVNCMSKEDQENLKIESSKATFRFGDSKPLSSLRKAYLPITICGKPMYLTSDVVEADIPLLLSKDTLDKGKAVCDYGNKTIEIYNTKQPMLYTSSGHIAIPINPHHADMNSTVVMHTTTQNENSDVKSTARKLHLQFGHPESTRLIKLVKDSGNTDTGLISAIEEISQTCDICKRYKKNAPRPIVSFPLAKVFNETVAMDLKVFKNNSIYFLHIIDHLTRFSAAAVIKSKKPEVIMKNFFQIWISIFGCPNTVLSDNGGEFANHQFMDMCENLNVRFITTAAEAPWSNGLVERHNDIIGLAVAKILEDFNCSVEVALCWSVNAKNSLQNVHGFSPYQLVFGRNPNLPSALSDKLPALEGVTSSQLVAEQLNALHKARQEFIQLESSEKLRRALRSKTRTHNNTRYMQGDTVYYKWDDEKRWRGPGSVIGQTGSVVLVKVPTGLVTVHTSRIILTSDAELQRKLSETNQDISSQSAIIDENLASDKLHPAAEVLAYGNNSDDIHQSDNDMGRIEKNRFVRGRNSDTLKGQEAQNILKNFSLSLQ